LYSSFSFSGARPDSSMFAFIHVCFCFPALLVIPPFRHSPLLFLPNPHPVSIILHINLEHCPLLFRLHLRCRTPQKLNTMNTRSSTASQRGEATSLAMIESTIAATVRVSCFHCGSQLMCIRHPELAAFHRKEPHHQRRRFKFLPLQRGKDGPAQLDSNMGCSRTVAARQRPSMGEA